MPPALFTSPFPRLDLTDEERDHLRTTADTLIGEVQTLYENYLWHDHTKIDAAKWALTRSKEDVCVYHDRRPGAGTGNNDMHLLLTVGTVVGTLHDAMYGVLNHTTDAMRIKTAYMQDTLVDSAVLETILKPSVRDPFQSMTVRWFVKGIPLHVRPIFKLPDSIYLEATGMKQLSNGEHVGFHLMHSISLAKTPPVPIYDRFNMSHCTMWRQVTPQRVEAFMTSYIEIKKTFLVPVVIKSTADAVVSLWKVIDCAQMKKLAYLATAKPFEDMMHDDALGLVLLTGGCQVCGSQSRSSRRGAKSACAVCSRATCKKCRVKRELAFITPNRDLLKQSMRFCLPCVTFTNRLDAAEVAQAEVPRSGSSRGSSVSSVRTYNSYSSNYNSSTSSGHTYSSTSSSVSDEVRYPKLRKPCAR